MTLCIAECRTFYDTTFTLYFYIYFIIFYFIEFYCVSTFRNLMIIMMHLELHLCSEPSQQCSLLLTTLNQKRDIKGRFNRLGLTRRLTFDLTLG